MTFRLALTAETCLPHDAACATLVGRLWLPQAGPLLVGVRGHDLVDLSRIAPTASELLELYVRRFDPYSEHLKKMGFAWT